MPPKQGIPSDKVLSLQTSNALEIQGYSLFGRKETKVTQIMGEYLENYYLKSKVITSGGMAENTVIRGSSDSDIMGVIRGLSVVDNGQQNNRENMTCISAIKTGCFPGYCKLKFSTEQYRIFKTSNSSLEHYDDILKCVKDMYISSKLFCENVIPDNLIRGDNFDGVLFKNNGPAITSNGVDYVYSFEMQTWPEEAKKWKSRVRSNNWPRKTFLNRLLTKASCYVTPVGHKLSTESDLEWRLSFVEIERELIWSMNETQYKCYVFLKMLKKDFFSNYPIFEDITTYHIKNIMFWMCENVPDSDWVPTKFILCVKRCLKRLEMCMKEKKLDHYIIPENNLFKNKMLDYKDIEPAFVGLHKGIYDLTAEFILHSNQVVDFDVHEFVSSNVIAYCDKCYLISVYCSYYYDSGFSGGFLKAFSEADLLMPCVQIVQALAKWREELWKSAERENEFHSDTDTLS